MGGGVDSVSMSGPAESALYLHFFIFFFFEWVSSAQDYINRTATPALFAPLMTQTSSATSEVLYLLTYLLTYLLARVSIEGLSSVKAPPLTTRLTPSALLVRLHGDLYLV